MQQIFAFFQTVAVEKINRRLLDVFAEQLAAFIAADTGGSGYLVQFFVVVLRKTEKEKRRPIKANVRQFIKYIYIRFLYVEKGRLTTLKPIS